MPTGKKCNWCEVRIYAKLDDFADYDWEAFQKGKDKVVMACPKHHANLMEFMKQSMTK